MPFKHSCFISHCHGQYDLTKGFVTQVKDTFENCLEPYFDQEVYIDEARLQPGYHYNEELSRAIYQSFCMIVIYTPKYATHSYCLREFMAMRTLEKKRLDLLENKSSNMGMIIPIIFRDDVGPLSKIRSIIEDEIQYCDFSKFSITNMEIRDNPDYVKKIDEIAKEMSNLYQKFEACYGDPCCECNSFRLPLDKDVEPWKGKSNKPIIPLGRGV
jgi:hypothetical protein